MKRLILLILAILPLTALAQDATFEKLMNEYSSKPHCTTINISKTMLRSMGVEMGADSVKAIAIEESSLIEKAKTQISELVTAYEVVMEVNSENERVNIYQLANAKGETTDLIITTISANECVILYIKGHNIEVEDATALFNF